MTKCLAIGLPYFVAAMTRSATDNVSGGGYQSKMTHGEDNWYCDEIHTKDQFDDHEYPWEPAQNRAGI